MNAPDPALTAAALPEPSYIVRGIPANLALRFWPFAEPYTKRALDRTTGEFSAADILDFIRQSLVQLWLVYDGARVVGAATTEVVTFPKHRRLRVLTVGGSNFSAWAAELDAKLCEWALTNRCDGVEAYVRRSFVPRLRKLGYAQKISLTYKAVR